MKRLVYAPKAYIFIRSSNLDGKIFDVSSDVVRGEVQQNLGDVSKASFELRNRYQKWLRDPDSGNRSIFLPMDMVTIWLQRIAGRPVQVFTGYLDSVPYYQGYPGNAMFEATCTLKKLAFTWFDPGLQTFFQWVQTNDGWYFDPSTGEGLNAPAQASGELLAGSAALVASGKTGKINDTGFANLLGRFMTDVAGWSPDDVLVSELPPHIPKQAAKLWSTIQKDTMQDITALEDYFSAAMGIKGWSNPDSATPTDSKGNSTLNPTTTALMTRVQKVADKKNVPILLLSLAAYVMTGYHETWSVGPDSNQWNWGYGVFALQPPTQASNLGSSLFGNDVIPTATTIDGKKPDDLLDASVATEAFCDLLNKYQGPWVKGARAGNLDAIVTWIKKVVPNFKSNDLTTAFAQAKKYATVGPVVTTPTATPQTSVLAQVSFNSANVQSAASAADKTLITSHYSSASPWLAAFILQAKKVSRSIALTVPFNKNANEIAFAGPASALQAFFNALVGNQKIDTVAMALPGTNVPQVLVNGTKSNLPPNTKARAGVISIVQTKNPTPTSTSSGGGSSSSSTVDPNAGTGAVSFQQLATFSANAAFAANFSFPTNVVESALLTGDRALMNDVSCLDAVKQFTKASLRTFRSLPDGRFLAFYPDYFGAYRKPYWSIYNIELTDFGIQLNDDSLATHVYVVGDTFAGDGQITMEDDVSTRGVATITQAFMLNGFIEPYKDYAKEKTPPAIGRLQDAYTFLQHYGARPHKEEQPIIRNTFYEFLMAWQKFMYLWSQQFATSVSFTFQPEVMAGGLIAFPDHDVQMFCESVTHTFDYTGGFSTSAVMTAPSLTGTNNDRTHKPGFALGGNINTVGVD